MEESVSFAGSPASFSHARNRQFLAPFHPAFRGPPSPPPSPRPFQQRRRAHRPFFLYPLFTSSARVVPLSFFTLLFANHFASRCVSSPSSSPCCFRLVLSPCILGGGGEGSSFLYHECLGPFYRAIMLALPLPRSPTHPFLLSFESLFPFGPLKLSPLAHLNFPASIFPFPS